MERSRFYVEGRGLKIKPAGANKEKPVPEFISAKEFSEICKMINRESENKTEGKKSLFLTA
jgi:hypothetical protein